MQNVASRLLGALLTHDTNGGCHACHPSPWGVLLSHLERRAVSVLAGHAPAPSIHARWPASLMCLFVTCSSPALRSQGLDYVEGDYPGGLVSGQLPLNVTNSSGCFEYPDCDGSCAPPAECTLKPLARPNGCSSIARAYPHSPSHLSASPPRTPSHARPPTTQLPTLWPTQPAVYRPGPCDGPCALCASCRC